jgi:hypothetical protein
MGGSPVASSSSSSGGVGGAGGATGSGGAPDPCGTESQCEAHPPEGWEGYFVVTLDVFPGSEFMGCPGGVEPIEYYAAPSPSTCSGCSCQVNATTCSTATLACYYMNDLCTAPASAVVENAAAGCSDFTALPADDNLLGSCQITEQSTLVTTGTCTPGTSELVEPDPWGEVVYACPPAPAPVECGLKEVCAPTPLGETQYICIAKAGEESCPDGFVNEIQAYEGGLDERSCGSCTCGPISCTNGVFQIYDGLACNDAGNPVVSLTKAGCDALSEYFDAGTASVKTIPPSPVAECPGGAGEGLVEATGPMKFCCK